MLYCVSDIHGEYELFMALLQRIGFSARDEMIVCGDILDKGTDGVRLAQFLFSQPNIFCIAGNHEHAFLSHYRALLQSSPDDFDAVLAALQEYLGGDGTLLDWDTVDRFEELPYYIERDGILCVHAGLPLDAQGVPLPLEATMPEQLVNDRRFKEPDVVCRFPKCVMFGHTPTSYICGADRILTYKRDGRLTGDRIADYYKIHLDTGASLHGVLGCFCVDNCTAYYVSKTDTVCHPNTRVTPCEDGFDAYVGCLLGGAAGDALGYAVEFLQDAAIFARYGEQGITRYDLVEGVAQISDDTQMTLFTAEGLLCAEEDREAVAAVHGAYLDWLETQNAYSPVLEEGLLANPALYSRRAPGNTCLAALESGICGGIEDPINHSKGCGGVMRVAPVALYYHGVLPQREIDLLAARVAAITHGHPLGYIPAAMLVHILCRVLDGAPLKEAVEDAMRRVPALFPGEAAHTEVQLALLEEAIGLSAGECDDLDAIRSLGEGWVAEETLAIAVYCALKHQGDFEKCLIAAVNHSGDSDSTGAVAGNLLGALLGAQGIPHHFVQGLELCDTISDLAAQLWEANGARK